MMIIVILRSSSYAHNLSIKQQRATASTTTRATISETIQHGNHNTSAICRQPQTGAIFVTTFVRVHQLPTFSLLESENL